MCSRSCNGWNRIKNTFDDTVSAMAQVGKALPETLRETALGGVAITKTGLMLKKKVFDK